MNTVAHAAQHVAFNSYCPLQHTTFLRPVLTPTTPIRRRPRTRNITIQRAKLQSFPENQEIAEDDVDEGNVPYEDLFVDEDERSFWEDLNVRTALRPITEEEKTILRSKLPPRVASFLIRRAEEAESLREPKADDSFFGKLFRDLPPDIPDEEDEEYKDYVFETVAGPPTFRRRGSSLFGGGDGLPDVEDTSMQNDVIDVGSGAPKNVMSLFIGRVGSIDEQASQVGYGLVALFVGYILIKILLAFVSFFVSFTFSFLAIFALSAGIFMVFFFFRW